MKILLNRITHLIEYDYQEKSMKTKTRSQYTSEWNEMQLNELTEGDIINLNEKGQI